MRAVSVSTHPIPSVYASSKPTFLPRLERLPPATASQHEAADNPDTHEVHKHKHDSIAKQKSGKGHWKPELASDSEEAVKADRAAAQGNSGDAIKTLQDRTKKDAEETSKAGTSMHDGL